MTGRAVTEWIGATPDTPIPDRVKLRIWSREDGCCYLSGRKILPADAYEYEHVIALSLWTGEGHGNRESNIRLALADKHKTKTAADRKTKAKSDRVKKRHAGIRPKTKFRGGRDSTFKRRVDGTVVYRDTGKPVR